MEKGSLDYSNVLHTKKKNGSFKNCSLKGSLGKQNWFLWHRCENPSGTFVFKSEGPLSKELFHFCFVNSGNSGF